METESMFEGVIDEADRAWLAIGATAGICACAQVERRKKNIISFFMLCKLSRFHFQVSSCLVFDRVLMPFYKPFPWLGCLSFSDELHPRSPRLSIPVF